MDKDKIEKLWENLESEPKGKQCTTQRFYDYTFSLDDSGEVFENLEPIYKIKVMMTETSAKIKFENKDGNGTDFQGQNITIGFL